MNAGRLEALSDGVTALLITIVVLELHLTHGGTFLTRVKRFSRYWRTS
ncbi:MAG TPA: TMEM175 family protein [Acidimicrobiales bacterium]|nr:TMEM175 family protein [Acidimicrobiales bacterium]